MTRRIEELDVPLTEVQRQMRELVARQRAAVAELPPITYRPRVTNPEPTTKEA